MRPNRVLARSSTSSCAQCARHCGSAVWSIHHPFAIFLDRLLREAVRASGYEGNGCEASCEVGCYPVSNSCWESRTTADQVAKLGRSIPAIIAIRTNFSHLAELCRRKRAKGTSWRTTKRHQGRQAMVTDVKSAGRPYMWVCGLIVPLPTSVNLQPAHYSASGGLVMIADA